jgi:hypothetical protein
VRHATCEHGESIDVPTGAVDLAHARNPVTAIAGPEAESDASTLHGHDHCPLASYHRTRSVEARFQGSEVPVCAVDVARRPGSSGAQPTHLDLVLLAPKTSPPA